MKLNFQVSIHNMKPWFCTTIVTTFLLIVSNLNHFANCAGVDSAIVDSNLFGPEKAADFLAKFGWITKSTPAPGQHQQIALGPGIRDFQSYFGLNVTGQLDSDTVTLMTSPRCGVPDKIPQASPLKLITKRFARFGPKWSKNVLTYQLTHYLARNPARGEVNLELRRAFDLWERVSNLEFRETNLDPDIEIRFEKGEHGDGAPFDGQCPPGNVLAHAQNPKFGGDIHFDDEEEWRLDGPDGFNIHQIAAHEIGHAIGLDHSDVHGAVMHAYYYYMKDFKLHPDDIEGVQSIYGRKIPMTPPPPPLPPLTPNSTDASGATSDDPVCQCQDKYLYPFRVLEQADIIASLLEIPEILPILEIPSDDLLC